MSLKDQMQADVAVFYNTAELAASGSHIDQYGITSTVRIIPDKQDAATAYEQGLQADIMSIRIPRADVEAITRGDTINYQTQDWTVGAVSSTDIEWLVVISKEPRLA